MDESLADIPRDRIAALAMNKKRLDETDKTQDAGTWTARYAEYMESKDKLLEIFGHSKSRENYQELDRVISEAVQQMNAHRPLSEILKVR